MLITHTEFYGGGAVPLRVGGEALVLAVVPRLHVGDGQLTGDPIGRAGDVQDHVPGGENREK
jgi:hypothetical protein